MADYGLLFNSGGPLMANPNPQTQPQQGMSVESILGNPAIQQVAFELAAALDPEGFGGRLAKAGLAMRQGQSAAAGFGKADAQGKKNSQLPQQPQQPQPTQTTANTNIANTAKQYTTLGTILKNAGSVDPSIIPGGYTKTFVEALGANPAVAQNPTQPVGNMFAGVPTGQAVQEPVQSQTPSLELDPSLAMTLTPDIISNIYTHSINKEKQSIDTAKTKWDMDPQRYQEDLLKAVAPGITQAYAMAYAGIEKMKAEGQFNSEKAEEFIANNPVIAKKVLPNGMTTAEFIRLNAGNPDAAKNITDLINVQKDYDAAIYSANMHYKAAKETADAQGRSDEFYKLTAAFQKFNEQATSKLMSLEEWNAKKPEERQYLMATGTLPRTAEAEEAIRVAQQMRDYYGGLLFGPGYSKMIESMRKLKEKTGDGKEEIADPTKLKQLEEEKRKRDDARRKQFPNLSNPKPNSVPTSRYDSPMGTMFNLFGGGTT